MMNPTKPSLFWLTMLWLVISPDLGRAAEPLDSVQATVDELLNTLYVGGGGATRDREDAVRSVIERRYPFSTIVQRALGQHWKKLSEAERREVIDLTTRLMIRSYTDRFAGAKRPEVQFGAAKTAGDRTEIDSTIRLDGANYKVVYRLNGSGRKWQLSDLVIEGVSLVSNYRRQFDSHFTRGNGPQLIAQLKAKLAHAPKRSR